MKLLGPTSFDEPLLGLQMHREVLAADRLFVLLFADAKSKTGPPNGGAEEAKRKGEVR